jgi:hypothetical protein
MSNHIIISREIDILSYSEKIWKIINKICTKPEKFYEKFLGVNYILDSPSKIIRTINFIGNIQINEELLIEKPNLIINKTGIKNCDYLSAVLKISVHYLDNTHCVVKIIADYIVFDDSQPEEHHTTDNSNMSNISNIDFYNKANSTITQLLYAIKTFSENLYSN